jgi:hypothetical protein
MVLILSCDDSPEIILGLVNNPRLPHELLLNYLDQVDELKFDSNQRRSFFYAVAQHPALPETKMLEFVETEYVVTLVENPSLSVELLEILIERDADTKSHTVIDRGIQHPKLPEELLQCIVKHPERYGMPSTLLDHPKLSLESVIRLMGGVSDSRERLRHHPNAPGFG